jgi:D-alanyl-D-alanine carboxypeptidase (penicillin-binding protein 5/6)
VRHAFGRSTARAGLWLLAIAALLSAGPAAAGAAPPNLKVTGACLVEAGTNQSLYGVNPNRRLPMASTTKLMTALVTLEREQRLSRIFTQNNYVAAAADSQIGLLPGERMSVHDLMLAMLIPSADDAAEDLAYNVGGGSVARFVGMMNARARELGLTHTHYSTPIGLDTPGNYTSACDLVKLSRFLLQHHPFFRDLVALPSATLKTGRVVRRVTNRNDLVGRVPWINGVKTGHTNGAGYVLVGSGTRGAMSLISAVLGTASETARDDNTLALLAYGFNDFRLVKPVVAGSVIARPTVRDRPGFHATVLAADSFTRVIARASKLTTRVEVPRRLVGPLNRHAIVGRVQVLVDGRVVGNIPLLLARRLPAVSSLTIAARFLTQTSTLLVLLAAAIGALIGLAVTRRERIGSTETSRRQSA